MLKYQQLSCMPSRVLKLALIWSGLMYGYVVQHTESALVALRYTNSKFNINSKYHYIHPFLYSDIALPLLPSWWAILECCLWGCHSTSWMLHTYRKQTSTSLIKAKLNAVILWLFLPFTLLGLIVCEPVYPLGSHTAHWGTPSVECTASFTLPL